MRCPEHPDARVTSRGGMTTLMAHSTYWDENDVYHNHDPNWHTMGGLCAEGCELIQKTEKRCPAESCSYGVGPYPVTIV